MLFYISAAKTLNTLHDCGYCFQPPPGQQHGNIPTQAQAEPEAANDNQKKPHSLRKTRRTLPWTSCFIVRAKVFLCVLHRHYTFPSTIVKMRITSTGTTAELASLAPDAPTLVSANPAQQRFKLLAEQPQPERKRYGCAKHKVGLRGVAMSVAPSKG